MKSPRIFRSLKALITFRSFIQTSIYLLRKEESVFNPQLLQDQSLASLHEVIKAKDCMVGIIDRWGDAVGFPRDPTFRPGCVTLKCVKFL